MLKSEKSAQVDQISSFDIRGRPVGVCVVYAVPAALYGGDDCAGAGATAQIGSGSGELGKRLFLKSSGLIS